MKIGQNDLNERSDLVREETEPEEAPFPLEKTKKLIRRLPPEDYEKVCRGLERLLRCLKSRAKAMESN